MQLFYDAREQAQAAIAGVDAGKLFAAVWRECSPDNNGNFK